MGKIASGCSTICTIAIVLLAAAPALAGSTADIFVDQLGKMYSSNSTNVEPAQPSKPAFETLRGNGTRVGYVLSHGSVIPGSESVIAAGSKKVRGRDYYIDYAGGSIIFMEPVPESHSITAAYRYAEKDKGERTLVGLPDLPIAQTKNLSLNLTYAYRTANRSSGQPSPDLVTYGVDSTTKLGSKSSVRTMLYVSSPENSTQVINHLAPESSPKNQQKPKRDELLVQQGEFGFGGLKLKLGYQNVGENFAGFAALQDANAVPSDLLGQLAKEKGLKRFDLEAGLSLGRGMSLMAASSAIKDKTDDIINRSLSFTSSRFKAAFGMSEVGKGFSRFKDIKEGSREQLAKEAGMKRSSFALEFASPGSGIESPWNRLGFNTISDPTGKIDTRSAVVSFGSLGLSYFHRSVGRGFSRLGSLSGDDVNRMALEIRQQFDPNANLGQVTEGDRKQIMAEAGIERTNMRASFAGSALKTDLQMLRIGDGRGSIERRGAKITGGNYSLSFMEQSIDRSFERLGSLAPVEKAEFGGESGIRRTNIAAAFKTRSGDLALGFSKVSDDKGASLLRQSLGLSGKKLNVKANFWDVAPGFDRIGDLADADREGLKRERGFRGTNLTTNIKFSDRLSLDSLYYGSRNSTANLARRQFQNNLVYTTRFGARVTMFRDQFSADVGEGRSSGYLHQRISLDHTLAALGGLFLRGLRDTKTTLNPDGTNITATVSQIHLESDKNKRTWLAADRKIADFGNGKFENLHSFNLTSKPSNRLSLTGALTTIDRDSGREGTRAYGAQWAISSRMSLSADVMAKHGNNSDITARRSYALSGTLADRIAMFREVKLCASRSAEDKQGKHSKDVAAVKIESRLAGGSFAAEYASLKEGNGNHPISRSFSFVSDRSGRKRLKFDL